MGRFETTADFYQYREPYPPEFFAEVAARLAFTPGTRMLDVGCGPANLAIGFAPFIKQCTAIDVEPDMLRVARESAAGLGIQFLLQPIETASFEKASFDFVTIGRALHWLSREATLGVFERIVTPSGCIAVCGSMSTDSPGNEWVAKFREVRRTWASDPDESKYKINFEEWFAPSLFRKVAEITIRHQHAISISDLVRRGLSFSTNSPASLGDRRPQFESEVEAAVMPFATNGLLEEELFVKANVFARPA
jgi:SAM-dependent methyltransferase